MKKTACKIKQWAKAGRFRPLLLCYAVFFALWLLATLAAFCIDRALPETKLILADAQLSGMHQTGAGLYTTESPDPQMIFLEIDTPARLILLNAEFERGPGEMELFYTRKEGPGFSTRRRAIGAPQNFGWVYTLPPGRVFSLRADPGSFDENNLEISGITLNPRLPLSYYFGITLRRVLGFVFVPALAYAVFYIIIELSFSRVIFVPKAADKKTKDRAGKNT